MLKAYFKGISEMARRVQINKTQYFEGIKKEVWGYQIGGYQVLDKWLKDRKGRKLSLGNIQHYCKVATSLRKTMDMRKEIDEICRDVEKDVIEFYIQLWINNNAFGIKRNFRCETCERMG